MTDTSELLQQYYATCDLMSRGSCGKFLDRVVINSYPEPKPFGDVIDPWQREILAPKVHALEGLVGLREYSGPRSFLTVLPRGHDKSSLEGRILSWSLCYSPRRMEVALCAADRDQAALLTRAMEDEARLNPWFKDKLEFQRTKVVGPNGIVDIIPADATSAYGGRYNLIICDEVAHWKNDSLWSAIVSGREKVPGSLLVIITNAGLRGSWQENLILRNAQRDPNEWRLFSRVGKLASWMSDERWEKMRQLLPPIVARRVLDNEWVDPAEETGYLKLSEITACLTPSVVPVPRGAQCVAAVDYGATRDRTALVVGYQDAHGVVQVAELTTMQGSPGRPVAIAEVEKWITDSRARYNWRVCYVDPHQMESTLQKMPFLERVAFRGGKFNCEIATNLRSLILNRKLQWHPGHGTDFAGELQALMTKVTEHGYRFENAPGKHDDQAFAVAVMAMEAVKRPYHLPAPVTSELQVNFTSPTTLFGR